jgi:hypothetical protein
MRSLKGIRNDIIPFMNEPIIVLFTGIVETTNGDESILFIHCPFCEMTTGMQHAYNCPNFRRVSGSVTYSTIDTDIAGVTA